MKILIQYLYAGVAGKTTILKILGGKHMVEQQAVRVLGRSAFHDTALTASGDLSYLGGEVRQCWILCFYFYFTFISLFCISFIIIDLGWEF